MANGYRSLEFTEEFLDRYASRDFSASDRKLFKKALRLLDENEQHPSLRVHALQGSLRGVWTDVGLRHACTAPIEPGKAR